MSLLGTLDLVRRVLELEARQGYRNRAATGGLHRFFEAQFAQHDYTEATWPPVERLLGGMRRYEKLGSEGERHAQAQIILRDAAAAHAALQQEPLGAPGAPPPPPAATTPARAAQPVSGPTPAAPPPADRTSAGRREQDAPPAEPDIPTTPVAPPVVVAPGVPLTAPPAPRPEGLTLDSTIAEALGMRAQEANKLAKLGLCTVTQGLLYFPREHYDCRNPLPIHRLVPGVPTTLVGTLKAVSTATVGRQSLKITEAKVADRTGVIVVRWFNQAHVAKVLKPHVGSRIAVSGQPEVFNGKLQFSPRDYEFPDEDALTHTAGLVPVYPLTEGITQRWLRGVQKRLVDLCHPLLDDPLPSGLREVHHLPGLAQAVRSYHFPASPEDRAAARRRLAFEELLYIQLGMLERKHRYQNSERGAAIHAPGALEELLSALPFALTGAQNRAIAAITRDMARPVPMSRLLQGDVGSGKTVVAVAALLVAVRAGYQGVLMAPTEILAEQHARGLTRLLEPLGVRVALLTGSLTKTQRLAAYAGAAQGTLDVLVGTHALIQEGLAFAQLGVAVVDEQHRFGVLQRAGLRQKGFAPHMLVMTATPIPRTLALTLYGDLDVTVLDERPPGRQPIETRWLPSAKVAYTFVREQITLGRQAFVVCPMIEENEKVEARAAVAEQERLQREVFPDLRVGLLHGKMKPAHKEAVLREFRDGGIEVLVATSVVEVGIDIPNASVMVIQDANRFGLAQLHQFRGRVGRGADKSYCYLLADEAGQIAAQRLQAITRTDDGFALAEEDLRLRGPGEFWGTRQSGLPELRVAQLSDTATIEQARQAAQDLFATDPLLEQAQHALLRDRLREFWRTESELS